MTHGIRLFTSSFTSSFTRLFIFTAALACSGLAFSGLAAASPAQDLFDQAAYLLKINYGGFSRLEPKTLEQQFQLELDQACATQIETCPYSTAHPVIVRMVEALLDKHTNFVPAEQLRFINNLIKNGGTPEKIGRAHV